MFWCRPPFGSSLESGLKRSCGVRGIVLAWPHDLEFLPTVFAIFDLSAQSSFHGDSRLSQLIGLIVPLSAPDFGPSLASLHIELFTSGCRQQALNPARGYK